MITNKKKEVTV